MKKINSPSLLQIIILIIPLLFLCSFLVLPILYTLNLSFINKETGLFSINNYINVLTNSLNLYFIYWTFQQAIYTTIIAIFLGLGGSYILNRYNIPGKSIIKNFLTVPFLLPSIAVLIGFLAIYDLNFIFSYQGIILANLFYNLPLMIRLTEFGWQSLNPEYDLIAKSLGVSKIRYFRKVQLPHLLPTLLTASLLTFIYCFNSFAIVLVLGGVQYQTLEVRIYSLVNTTLNYNQASALAIIQLVINILIIVIYLRLSSKYQSQLQSFAFDRSLLKKKRKIAWKEKLFASIVILFYTVVIFIICILPMLGVFYKSLISNYNNTISLKNFNNLFNGQINKYLGLSTQAMITNSIVYAILVFIAAILLSLLLNFGLNYKISNSKKNHEVYYNIISMVVILPLMVSAITLIYSIFSLYNNTVLFDNVSLVIVIAQTLIAFPFAYRIISTSRSNLSTELLQVGQSVGLSRMNVFFKIELPILIPSIIVAGLFSFAISLGEFASTNFVSRGSTATIPIGIYRLISTRHIPEASAFSSILIIITLIMFLSIEKIGKGSFDYRI